MKHKIFFTLLLMLASMSIWAQEVITEDENGVSDTVQTYVFVSDTIFGDTISLSWEQKLQARLDLLLDDPMFETSQVGLFIYDLTADSALYRHNERQLMRPASTMKMVTAVTALDQLGGSYQFRTRLLYTGEIANRTLTGNIYSVGGFDPRFNGDDMTAFVNEIRELGIDTIRGRLLADKSMKDADLLGEGWCWDDDNPTLSPLLLNRKDVFMDQFMSKLRAAGVVLDVMISEDKAPFDAQEICSRTHSMDQILQKMMKDSDNLYAEAMFYQLSSVVGKRPATAKNAASIVRKLIARVGLNPSDYKIADGSGLSLYNYVTPEMEMKLLKYAYRNGEIYSHLHPSMPIAGVDGTLKKRMRKTAAEGNVHAKTGTVTAVSCLAGYATAPNGHTLCFSIMNNGLISISKGRAFQDKVCTVMCE